MIENNKNKIINGKKSCENSHQKILKNDFTSNNIEDKILSMEIRLPTEILEDINRLCKLFTIDKTEFIANAIYNQLIYYHETPDAVIDELISSKKVVSVFESIRMNINRHFGEDFLVKRYESDKK